MLNRTGPFRAVHARDGEMLESGTIYVAPPDRHMLVAGETLRLTRGPKENHTRPAIDSLLRTAAVQWRERVIGVILSGQLDDIALHEAAIHLGEEVMDRLTSIADPSTLTCPDCGGTLWQVRAAKPERYRCHTGHAFTSLSLESAQAESAEGALWAAMCALREREMLLRRLARLAQSTCDERQAAAGEAKADEVHGQVLALGRKLEAEGAEAASQAADASA